MSAEKLTNHERVLWAEMEGRLDADRSLTRSQLREAFYIASQDLLEIMQRIEGEERGAEMFAELFSAANFSHYLERWGMRLRDDPILQ